MAKLEYDVVFFDNVSSTYVEETPFLKGIGGSELGIITLSQELARNGFSVLVLNDPLVLKSPDPSPLQPIGAASGVHYASCRGVLPPIECGTLIIQRFSSTPPLETIKRDRTVVWLHDACNNPGDPTALALHAATSKALDKGGAIPIFVSEWQRKTYPQNVVGRHSRVIPNMLPRLVFDEKYRDVPQEDTMVFASAAVRGLDATLTAWADSRVASAGKTVLEIMGPVYDPPPNSPDLLRVKNESLEGRIRLMGSLPLPALIERMAASRGLLFVNTWPETFCLLVAYSEALGKPARFIGMSRDGLGGVKEAMVNSRFLYVANEWDRFLNDLAREISSDERLSVEPVTKFHPDTLMPMWFEALGLEV
jgi:hypothetical protein